MEFVLGMIVGAVITFYWVTGNHKQETERLRQSVKVLGEELAGYRQKYYTLQQQFAEARRQFDVMAGDYEARQTRLLGSIGRAAANIDQVLALLPQVEDVRSYLNRLDPADVGKLDLPFAHEFQKHMTQSYSDNLQAMGNLFHGLLKLSLGLHYLKATGATLNPGLRFTGGVFEELKGTLIEYAQNLDMPGFRERFARMIAISIERMERAYLGDDPQPDPQLVADLIQAFDEASEMLPEKREGDLPDNVVILPHKNGKAKDSIHTNGHRVQEEDNQEEAEDEQF